MSDFSFSSRRGHSFSQSGSSTPFSQGGGSQQSGGNSQASTAQTTPAATPIDTAPKPFPATPDVTAPAAAPAPAPAPVPVTPAEPEPAIDTYQSVLEDPLGAHLAAQQKQVRSDLEDGARITHAVQGPKGVLGLSVTDKNDVTNQITPVYARLRTNVSAGGDANMALTMERNTLTLSGTSNVSGGTLTTGLTNSAGFVHANTAFTSASNGSTFGGLLGAASDGTLGAGLNTVRPLGTSVGMGGSLIGLAKPDGGAQVIDVKDGQAGVEYRRGNYLGGQATVSVGGLFGGVAVRLFSGFGVTRRNQDNRSRAQAGDDLNNNSALSRVLYGLNFKRLAAPPVNVEDNTTLPAGRQATEERSENNSKSMAVSVAGVHLGHHLVKNRNSMVALRRSNSGNSKQLTLTRMEASTRATTVDVPVISSATRGTSRLEATQLSLQMPEEQDTREFVRRSKSAIDLTQSLLMPESIRSSALNEIRTPYAAVQKVREIQQSGVAVEALNHSVREQKMRVRASVLPLTATLLGPLASANLERNVSSIHTVVAQAGEAAVIKGRERLVVNETYRVGIKSEAAAYLQVHQGKAIPAGPNESEESWLQDKSNYLTVNRFFEQCDADKLRLLGKWAQSFTGPAVRDASLPQQAKLDRFAAAAQIRLLLEPADKLELHRKGFFPSLTAEMPEDAAQQQALLQSIDELLTKMVETDTDVVQQAARTLNRPYRIEVNAEVDLVEKLTSEANALLVKTASSSSATSGPLGRKTMNAFRSMYDKAEETKQLLNFSLFGFTPHKRATMMETVEAVESQLLAAANVQSAEELLRASSPTQPAAPLPTAPSEPLPPTADGARHALATPATFESTDGDLGLIALQTRETY